MFIEVTKAEYLDGYRVKLLFNNGETKIADLSQSLNGAVFAPMKDIKFFKRFSIKFNTIEWENGADFAPESLYEIGVIIQRLDSFVSDGAASYDEKMFTIKHVLPQTVNPESQWAQLWPEEKRRSYWLHKIANLVPLARKINSAAQNYDFKEKKEKYFTNSRTGTTSYNLTTQVLSKSAWTEEVVVERQNYLMDVFKKNWELY